MTEIINKKLWIIMKSYSKNPGPLKGLYQFITRNNAAVIALELAIFAGVIFALAAEPETEIGGNLLNNEFQGISTNFASTSEPISTPIQESSQTTEQAIVENNELGIMNQEIPEGGTELVEKRTENSKTRVLGYTEDGKTRYSLDSSIGAIHYKDDYSNDNEQWKDIDLTWEGNKITKAPHELTLEGKKIIVRDKKTGDVSTIELLDIKPAGLQYEIVPGNTSVSFRHTLPNDNVPFEAKFRVTGNIPLRTRAFDDDGELELETTLVNGILTEKLTGAKDKETGKARPVKGSIKIDPTLDLQVGASADDGHVAGFFANTGTTLIAGYITSSSYHAFYRFTGITIPQSSVIDVAYISLYEATTVGTPLTKIYADDQNNPTAVTSVADYSDRALTTAGVDMDGDPGADAWYNSPSIVSVIQELVNSYGYVNQAVQIMHKDDGLAGANYRRSRSYDNTTSPANTWGPKLHIEYTAAGGGYQPRPGGVSPSGGGFMMF